MTIIKMQTHGNTVIMISHKTSFKTGLESTSMTMYTSVLHQHHVSRHDLLPPDVTASPAGCCPSRLTPLVMDVFARARVERVISHEFYK